MIILGLDTSHKTGSLCLAQDSHVLFEKTWENEKSHAEFITEFTNEALSSARVSADKIDLYAVNVGPGSFTGIRISINLVKTFAYVNLRPIFIQNSLELLAAEASVDAHSLYIAINAHSGLCYSQEFTNQNSKWVPQQPIRVEPFEAIIPKLSQPHTLFCGDAFEFYQNKIPHQAQIHHPKISSLYPRATVLAQLAFLESEDTSKIRQWNTIEPFYLRPSAPEEKLQKQKNRP